MQNEIHPYYQENDVIPHIQDLGSIVVQGWYLLGGRGHTAERLSRVRRAGLAAVSEKRLENMRRADGGAWTQGAIKALDAGKNGALSSGAGALDILAIALHYGDLLVKLR